MSMFFSPMFLKSLLPPASSILCSPLVLHYVLFCFRVFVVFSWADSAEGVFGIIRMPCPFTLFLYKYLFVSFEIFC